MKFEYPPGATPIDPDEAHGLIPAHLTVQRELNEYEEANILEAVDWLSGRRRRTQNLQGIHRGSRAFPDVSDQARA